MINSNLSRPTPPPGGLWRKCAKFWKYPGAGITIGWAGRHQDELKDTPGFLAGSGKCIKSILLMVWTPFGRKSENPFPVAGEPFTG